MGDVAPVADWPGAWIAAASTGIALLTADGTPEWLDRPEDRTPVRSRMNHCVADPAGHFWAGSMAYDGTHGAGSLYRTDPDGLTSPTASPSPPTARPSTSPTWRPARSCAAMAKAAPTE